MAKFKWLFAVVVFLLIAYYCILPFFNGPKISYKSLKIENLSGIAVVPSEINNHPKVVVFWGTWCGQCIQELPLLTKYQQNFKGKIDFILLSDEPSATILSGIKKHNIAITCLRSVQSFKKLSVNFIPLIFFYDKYDNFIAKESGMIKESILSQRLEELIQVKQ